MVLKKEVINILRDKCQEMAKTIILSGDFFNALYELIPEWIAFDQVDRMKGQPMTTAASTSVTGMGIHKEREPSGTSYSYLFEEVSPYQADTSRGGSAAIGGVQPVDPTQMQLDVTDTDYKPEAKKFKRMFFNKKCEQGQPMTTAASTSVTDTKIHEGREASAMGSVLKQEVKDRMCNNLHPLATFIKPTPEVYNSLNEWIPNCSFHTQVDRMKKSHQDDYTQATRLVEYMMHRTDDEFIQFCKVLIAVKQRGVVEKYFSECLELLGTSYNILLKEVIPSQTDTSQAASAAPGSAHSAEHPHGCDAEKMHLDVTDDHYKVQVKKSTKKFYGEKCEQGQHMPTAASASATGTGIHEEGRQSGETVSESTWRFEISNKADYLKSGSILPYPMEIFVPTGALSGITELKVTVTQMTNDNPPSPSEPGNRQFGPIIRFEADQAKVRFVHPLLVLVRFPEEFMKHTDDYEYSVQYNSDKNIHDGTWSNITGYNEGQVCGEVIPSHQTAVLLLPHFSLFGFFQWCKMMNVELYANPPQLQNTRTVLVTCLVYLQPLCKTAEYKAEREDIRGEYNTSESMDVSKRGNEESVSLTAVGHESEQWRLKFENLRTQKIPIDTILENNFMKKHFVFQGQGQLEFSCNIATKIPGCSDANPQVLILPQERDQAVKNPSSEHGKNAANDLSGSVQPVENTKPLIECINPGFLQQLNSNDPDRLLQTTVNYKEVINSNGANSTTEILMNITNREGLVKLNVIDDHYKSKVKPSTKEFYEEKREQAYPMDTKRKGFALVINVQCKGAKNERKGTDIDRNKIVSLLEQLDFESPTVYNDKDGLTHEDILDKVKAFAMTVHKEARRVAVFILSHGDKEDVIYGTDGKTVPVHELVDAINVHRLAGIPKMVVFQTCRGVMTDNVEQNNRPPDLITCYAAKKDYVSYRHADEGSWFIAAIVQIFEKHAHEFEIRKLMDMVQLEVENTGKKIMKIQTPEAVHNLQKEWFLFPGYPKF